MKKIGRKTLIRTALITGAISSLITLAAFAVSVGSQGWYALKAYLLCYPTHTNSSIQKQFCYAHFFIPLTASHSPEFAIDTLRALQKIDTDLGIDCHYVAHAIGKETYVHNKDTWGDYFATFPTMCREGGTHGIFEAYLDEHGTGKESFTKLCDTAETLDGYCFHMAGHVLLAEHNGDIEKSLEQCDWLDMPSRRNMCYAAVFMENQTSQILIGHHLRTEANTDWAARLPEFKSICAKYTGDKATACWMELGLVFISTEHSDPKKVYEKCAEGAPSEWAEHECIKYAAEIMASSLAEKDILSEAQGMCDPISSDALRRECFGHIVSTMLMQNPKYIGTLITFCGAVPEPYKKTCYGGMGYYNAIYAGGSGFTPLQWQEACKAVPQEYRTYCSTTVGLDYEKNFRWLGRFYVRSPYWDGTKWISDASTIRSVQAK